MTYSSAIGTFVIGESPIGGTVPSGTQIPPITAAQFAQRLAAVFPNGWCSPDAKQSGIMSFLFGAIATGLAFQITSLQYALAATRIQTAVNGALDLASEDFFGSDLPRYPGEPDAAFSARILAALSLLGQGATRAAVTAAVAMVTGQQPFVVAPWSPIDTGVWDGDAGEGMMFWDVDVPGTPFRWTGDDAYQGFITTVLQPLPVLGGNPLNCFDVGNQANGWYFDTPPTVPQTQTGSGSAWFDFPGSANSGVEKVYEVINITKVFGTAVWVKFLPNLTTPLHQ